MSKEGGGAKRWVLLGTDYVYPRTTNKILRAFLKSQGRRRQGHRREVHAVRPQRLPDHRRRHQEVRRRRQDRGGLDHQRRLERAVLQGARQPGPEGDRRAGGRVLGRRRRAARRRHQAAGRPPGGLELLHVAQEPGERRVHRRSGRPTPRRRTCPTPTSRSPTTRWKPPTSASTCGSRRSRRPRRTDIDKVIAAMAGQTFKAPSGFTVEDGREEPPPAQAGVHRRSQGRRPVQRGVEDARARSRPQPWSPFIAGNDKKKDEPEKNVSRRRSPRLRRLGAVSQARRRQRPA